MSNYLIGLSIGLSEVGYSVCDENGKLMRFKGKNMWGISRIRHMTAEKVLSSARWIRCLQERFFSEISNIDPKFFERIGLGLYGKHGAMSLVSDTAADRKALIKRYPTVYHLRERLAHDICAEDLRLTYLALHHMLKRGGTPEKGIAIYEKYKRDLALLKRLYRRYRPDRYGPMFRRTDSYANYVAYSAMPPSCTRQAFYDQIRADLNHPRWYEPDLLLCLSEVENATFLPRAGDLALYEPPAAGEVLQILDNQKGTHPFLERERESIMSLFECRRSEWVFAHWKSAVDCAAKILREIVKIQGGTEPERIFITYDIDYGSDIASLRSELMSLGGFCKHPVVLVRQNVLENAKRTLAVLDGRAANDDYPAQNAFLALSLGRLADLASAYEVPARISGSLERAPDTKMLLRYPEQMDEIKRVFDFKGFFESGIPETFRQDGFKKRAPRPSDDEISSGEEPACLYDRILYDGTEYGVCASGELICLAQIRLSQRSLRLIDMLFCSEGQVEDDHPEYSDLYGELLDKAEMFSPFYKHSKAFSEALRSRFSSLPTNEKRKCVISLLHGLRAGRPCGIFVKQLSSERVLCINRSVTGMFEQKRKLE